MLEVITMKQSVFIMQFGNQTEIGDRRAASSLNNLGLIADVRGDYDEAERLHNASLAINGKLVTGEASQSLGNLGLIADDRGDYDEAERLHNASLAIAGNW